MLFAAAGAVAGHVWSIYLRLYTGNWGGGRGVATAMGAMMVVNPWNTSNRRRSRSCHHFHLALCVARLNTRFSHRGFSDRYLGSSWASSLSLLFISIAAFVIIAHHDNIDRLLKGTERKIGEHAKV